MLRFTRLNGAELNQALQRIEMLRPFKVTAVSIDDLIEKQLLLDLKRLDALFNGPSGNHAVNEHRIRLTNPMHAVDGLILHRGIPPRIEQENIVRCM